MEYLNTVTVSDNFVPKSLPGPVSLAVHTVCALQIFFWNALARSFRIKNCVFFWEAVIPEITLTYRIR